MIVSQHQLNDFISNKKKYYYRYILGLKKKEISMALELGTIVHKAILEWISSDGDEKNEKKIIMEALSEAKNQENVVTANAMIGGFFKRYRDLFKNQVTKSFTDPDSEIYVRVGDDYISCHPDIIYQLPDKSIWIGEIKTTSNIEDFADGLPLDFQINMYFHALKQHSEGKGWKPSGVHYLAIRKPSIRQKKSESLEDFLDRIQMEYQSPESFGKDPSFYFRDEKLLMKDSLIEEDLKVILKDLKQSIRQNLWYCDTSKCNKFGGCEYRPLCSTFPENRQMIIDAYYERKEEKS